MTYGELTGPAAVKLCEVLNLNDGDAFVDIGSGFGHVVMIMGAMAPSVRCLGYEFVPAKHLGATRALCDVRGEGHALSNVAFYEGDAADLLRGAHFTHAYAFDLCFESTTHDGIARALRTMKTLTTFATFRSESAWRERGLRMRRRSQFRGYMSCGAGKQESHVIYVLERL